MFPKEIIRILEEHKGENNKELNEINKNIEFIKSNLKSILDNLFEQLSQIAHSDTIDGEDELWKDIKILRNYINSIELLNVSTIETTCIQEESENISSEQPTMPKPVKLYLCENKVCPICHNLMQETHTYYSVYNGESIENNTLNSYRCNICHKFFVCDYVIGEIDINKTNLIVARDYYTKIPEVDVRQLIVLKNTLYCSSQHNTHDLIAKIPVLNEEGELHYIDIPASYCSDCCRFTILKEEFDKIKDIVICKIIDETISYNDSFDKTQENDFVYGQNKSLLYQYGYNVQTKKNLSKIQRQRILAILIESGIMTKREIIDHIATLIERGSKIESWNAATQKWFEDKCYVADYKSNSLPKYIIDSVILKYRKSEMY